MSSRRQRSIPLGGRYRQVSLYRQHASLIAKFMGPFWGRQDPGGPHVGPMNFAIWDVIDYVRWDYDQTDGLVQERRNSCALAMELRLSCTNTLRWYTSYMDRVCGEGETDYRCSWTQIPAIVQGFDISIANALEIPRFYTKPLIWWQTYCGSIIKQHDTKRYCRQGCIQ